MVHGYFYNNNNKKKVVATSERWIGPLIKEKNVPKGKEEGKGKESV